MPEYGPETALVVVDVQNDFADPAGSLYVQNGERVVPIANREIREAREAGATVVFTQDWHPPKTPHFVKQGGTWPVHCVRDTWGAELHPGLDLEPDDIYIKKGTEGEDGYSAFCVRDPESGEEWATELAERLRERNIDSLVVLGLAADVCVKETALDANRIGFATTVLAEGTAAVEQQPGDRDRTFAHFGREGIDVA